jgi:hypothetical protein
MSISFNLDKIRFLAYNNIMFQYCAPNALEKLGAPVEILEDRGYEFMEIIHILNQKFVWRSHCEFNNKFENTVLSRLPKTGKFLIVERDHAFAVIDGVNKNNLESIRRKKVDLVYEIIGSK